LLESRTPHQPGKLRTCQRTIMFLLFLFWESMKNARVYLLYMQSSAGPAQATDRIWCKPAKANSGAVRRSRCSACVTLQAHHKAATYAHSRMCKIRRNPCWERNPEILQSAKKENRQRRDAGGLGVTNFTSAPRAGSASPAGSEFCLRYRRTVWVHDPTWHWAEAARRPNCSTGRFPPQSPPTPSRA